MAPWLEPPAELFARSYVQWLAWKSGSSVLQRHLDLVLHVGSDRDRLEQWPYWEVLPIAATMDKLFEEAGMAAQARDVDTDDADPS